MNVGEIAELKIASRFGYGEKGLNPKVQGGARLVYTVELVTVKPEILPDDLTPIERLNIGFVHLYLIIKLNCYIIKNYVYKVNALVDHRLLIYYYM